MKRSALLVLLLIYGGYLATLWTSRNVFERIPYLEDEIAYVYQAKIFAGGQAYIEQEDAEVRRAFWQPFVINCGREETEAGLNCEGKRFGKYPPGWPMVYALGFKMGADWMINPFIVMLTIALVYRLAAEIFDRRVGVVSALLLTISPIAWLQAGSGMSHTFALFCVTLFLYGVWRIEKSKRWSLTWGLVAGLAIGMLFSTRPLVGVSVVAPFIAYSFFRLGVSMWRGWRDRRQKPIIKLQWGHETVLYLGLLAGATALAVWVVGELKAPKGEPAFPDWPVEPVYYVSGILAVFIIIYLLYRWIWVVDDNDIRVNPSLTHGFRATFVPLILLGIGALLTGSLHFAFNYVTTGHATENLYLIVWDYDKVGFGEDVGTANGGHSWLRAKRNLHWDTECYARDLFGWVEQPNDAPDKIESGNGCMKGEKSAGLSWILLPLGLVFGWRKRWLWLLASVAIAIVFGTLFYWVNASIYSARYYFEMTSVLAIISAVGVIGIVDIVRLTDIPTQFGKIPIHYVVYALLLLVSGYSAFEYAPNRVMGLHQYSPVSRDQLDAVDRWRIDPDRDVLIISYGRLESWRLIGGLMGVTSPYLDSEYVVARDPNETRIDKLLEMFPDREVVWHYDGLFLPARVGYVEEAPPPN